MARESIGYVVVDETNPRARIEDFHFSESDAVDDCMSRLDVSLQYGPSNLAVVRAVKRGFLDIVPCMTAAEIRTWNNIKVKTEG